MKHKTYEFSGDIERWKDMRMLAERGLDYFRNKNDASKKVAFYQEITFYVLKWGNLDEGEFDIVCKFIE